MKIKASSLRIAVKLIIVQPDQTEKKNEVTDYRKMDDKSNIATYSTDIWNSITK